MSRPAVIEPEPEPSPKPHWVEIVPEGYQRRERPPVRFVRVPPIEDYENPFLWKELNFGGKLPSFEMDALRGCSQAFLLLTVSVGAFSLLVNAASTDRPQEVLNPVFRYASILIAAVVVPFAGVRAAGCVSYERRRQTLDSLFTLPVDRGDILAAKGWAALQWLRYWLFGYAAVALVPLATGSVPIVGFLLTLAMIASAIPFFLALAVWLSVRCVTVVRSTTWYIAATFATFLLPPMVADLVRATVEIGGGSDRFLDSFVASSSQPFAIAYLTEIEEVWRLHDRLGSLSGTAAGAMLISLLFWFLAWRLWHSAVRRFENEGR